MSQVPVLPALDDEPVLLRDLREPIEQRLLQPSRSIAAELEIVGVTTVPERPLVQRTANGTWFFAADYLADPGLSQDGAIAVPERELARLRALRDAGVSLDLIWIAHELPQGWQPDQPLPAIVPDARRYRELDRTLERVVSTTINTSLEVVRRTARGIAIGALGVGAAVTSGGTHLDPIVLGGIRHPERDAAAWAVLARWEWD